MPAAQTIRSERNRLDDPACSVSSGVLHSRPRSLTTNTHQRARHAFTWPLSYFRATPGKRARSKRCTNSSVSAFSLGSRSLQRAPLRTRLAGGREVLSIVQSCLARACWRAPLSSGVGWKTPELIRASVEGRAKANGV